MILLASAVRTGRKLSVILRMGTSLSASQAPLPEPPLQGSCIVAESTSELFVASAKKGFPLVRHATVSLRANKTWSNRGAVITVAIAMRWKGGCPPIG
jgi:hypothetical protein